MNKELLLINPRLGWLWMNVLHRLFFGTLEPHALMILESLTPNGYRVRRINQRIIWMPWHFKPGMLVGISCLTAGVTEAYRLADAFRKAGSVVILGGCHVSALPEEALQHADSVVVGEAESVWRQVLADYEAGHIQQIYRGVPLSDFLGPAYEYFLQIEPQQLRRAGLFIDRGCKYTCDFCSRISDVLRFVKLEQVIGLVKHSLQGARNLWGRKPLIIFLSDNIFSSPPYAKKLFEALIPLNIHWIGSSSVDIGFDEEAMDLARASGCRQLFVGFETTHPREYCKTSLDTIQSPEDYRTAIRNLQSRGINILGSFILGLDSYGHRDYARLLWFLMRTGLWHVHLTMLTPIPGSSLFARLKEEGRILSYDWRLYNLLVCVIKPKRMSRFALYAWFFVIRCATVLFSRMIMPMVLAVMASWYAGDWLMRRVLQLFL
jgi:radical SAM superfamily enzyme YgiQ (UPF0313 family)